MKELDITAYLEGRLTQQEREAFERAVREDPALAEEVELTRSLVEDLDTQGLRRKVEALRSAEQPPARGAGFPWLPVSIVLVLLLGLGVFLWWPRDNAEPPSEPHPSETPPVLEPEEKNEAQTEGPNFTLPEQESEPQPDAPPAEQPPRPMAEAEWPPALNPPPFSAPRLRGQSAENPEQKALLDQLWYTAYPPGGATFEGAELGVIDQLLRERQFPRAYVQLQRLERKGPATDTLHYLKAYTLLELGQGDEALRYFDRITQPPAEWEPYINWHRSLAYLLKGEIEKASAGFEPISAREGHPFRQEAAKALELLE